MAGAQATLRERVDGGLRGQKGSSLSSNAKLLQSRSLSCTAHNSELNYVVLETLLIFTNILSITSFFTIMLANISNDVLDASYSSD